MYVSLNVSDNIINSIFGNHIKIQIYIFTQLISSGDETVTNC